MNSFGTKNRLTYSRMISFFTPTFQIYTDGSHKQGWGSWAFVVTKKNKVIHEFSGRERHANSNQMEFQAALNALKFLPSGSRAELFTDSRILINTIHGKKKPKVFEEQMTELQSLLLERKISWHWVKAHSGIKFNERCDELCIQARQGNFYSVRPNSKSTASFFESAGK